MKNKTLIAFLAGSIATLAASQVVTGISARKTPRGSVLVVKNTEATFNALEDGGVTVTYRACGHENGALLDGGAVRLSEPCWTGTLPAGVAVDLARALLSQGAPLLEK